MKGIVVSKHYIVVPPNEDSSSNQGTGQNPIPQACLGVCEVFR